MRCGDARAALSARLDDELPEEDVAPLREHVAGCAACATYDLRLDALRRRLRIGTPQRARRDDPVAAVVAAVAASSSVAPLSEPPAPVPLGSRPRAPRRRRIAAIATAAAAIVAAGVLATAVVTDDRPDGVVAGGPAALGPATGDGLLLVWTSGGLDPTLASRVAAVTGVRSVVAVRGDVHDVPVPGGRGLVTPVDVLAVEPHPYARLVPADLTSTVDGLGTEEVLVGATAARTRGLEVGDRFDVGLEAARTVRAVLPDALVGGADAVVSATATDAARLTPRFLLVEHDGERAEVEASIRRATPRVPMRFRSPAEARVLRHGDAVLPLPVVEARFGPLTYRDDGSDRLAVDPAWQAEALAEREVAGVGRVRCHRAVVDELVAALDSVAAPALTSVSAGPPVCFDPHRGELGLGPSRHTYGIAVAFRVRGTIAPEVVDALEARGFTWGGRWLEPEPERFEWVGS